MQMHINIAEDIVHYVLLVKTYSGCWFNKLTYGI